MSAPGDPPTGITGGISLPIRHASVTVLGHVDEADEHAPHGHHRRDSLETTKSFYAQKPSYNSNGSLYRPPSTTSRATGTVRARSDSHISATTSRAATPSGNPLSPISPPRTTAPLPTPKGFLSPKKSAAAQRLERGMNGRTTASVTSKSHYKDTSNASEVLSDTTTQNGQRYEPSVASNFQSRQETMSPTFSTMLSPEVPSISLPSESLPPDAPTVEIPHIPGPPMGTAFNSQDMWDRSLRHSITTVSSPPRAQALELSSDNLVHRLDQEKASDMGRPARWQSRGSRATFERIRNRDSPVRLEERRRKYETIDNPLATFLCGGRVLVGGDVWYSMGAALLVLFAISGVWIGTTGAWMWSHGSEYGLAKGGGVAITIIFVYLFCLVTSSFAVTALRDPGIIPRKLDPDPPKTFIEQWWEAYPRDLTVKEGRVTVKYCETCESYRAPRCSHCRLCGNCVDGIDHHCSYLHTCVGKRNYFSFIVLLVTATISDIYIVVFSAVHFSLICHHDHVSFGQALKDSPGAAVSFLLGVLTLFPVIFLLQYHIRLLLLNITTLEQIRANTSNSLFALPVRPDNPFAQHSTWANVVQASIGRPQFPSWIDPSGWEVKDMREVNPALSVSNRFDGRAWV
ncbi:hypothetical protein, variant 1 [Cryptococcus amylolentus CBS 6039]|uniref:Palmitoyltransferase n=2 Tax=Cryptococcus amylolentus CBS 6039 TaxID=1295533 RepID=A0A1E3I2H0_9TREE|nr:hypothetical protein, variant 1 [Cryptococcus amylolentus CBS 6039]ODN82051.1 hypothetical protein, variant 1 [Cryptococcus amylolentus CBS 6039]